MRFRLRYADTIPDLPPNNLNLKLSYPFRVERHHAAAVMGNNLEVGVFIEDAAENQARHGAGGIVRPPEKAEHVIF